MKLIIWLVLMIAMISSALAISGGESWLYHFPECDKLRVNITGNLTIDVGEYTIHNECEETYENYFICNCSDDFYFNVSFEINTINNYQFNFNYDYTKEVVEISDDRKRKKSEGGGGRAIKGMIDGIRTTTLNYGDVFIFHLKEHRHIAVILKVTEETIKLRVQSAPQDFVLKEGETKELDTDGNGLNDFSVTLNEITSTYGGEFTFTVLDETKPIVIEEEPITEEAEEEIIDVIEEEIVTEEAEEELVTTTITTIEIKKPFPLWIPVTIIIFVVGISLIFYYSKKAERGGKQNESKN